MRKTNNVIEINGQRYDAATGELLTPGGQHKAASHIPPPAVRRAAKRSAHHRSAHPPAPSRTLMRQAVKKPGPATKHRLKAQGHTDTLVQRSLPVLAVKPSVLHIDEKRLQHAKHINKSRFISRFSPAAANPASNVRPTPTASHGAQAHKPANPVPQAPVNSTEALLEHALQQANSYRELPAKHRRLGLKRHAGASR